ncbi:hypothetical protein ACFOU0_05930 [Salinicoccus sesuvii]|uniref:Uncharacterized protein n=1 Tax=Salinicoccus sesuvii TaxID=868281 RepID=A0ABV7N5H8_9STAP
MDRLDYVPFMLAGVLFMLFISEVLQPNGLVALSFILAVITSVIWLNERKRLEK